MASYSFDSLTHEETLCGLVKGWMRDEDINLLTVVENLQNHIYDLMDQYPYKVVEIQDLYKRVLSYFFFAPPSGL